MARMQRYLLIGFLALAACKTPSYVEEVPSAKPSANLPFASEVSYSVSDNFKNEEIGCIAVSKFSVEHKDDGYADIDQAAVTRKSVYGVLSAKNYRDVELARVDFKADELGGYTAKSLLKSLDCDALLQGEVLAFKNDYFVTYSVTTVELQLTLVNRNGDDLWSARHAASSHEGAMPLSPLSLLSGIFTATTNQQDEVAFQMVDAVARRLLKTLPDGAFQMRVDDAIGNIIDTKVAGQAKTEKPDSTAEDTETAMQLLAKGAYEQALVAAQADIEANGSDGEAYFVAARASLLLSDTTAAIDYSLSALANGHETSSTYSGLGVAYLQGENWRLANASFRKAAELDPTSSQVQFNLALVAEVKKDISKASEYYYEAGNLALQSQELSRVHKALTALRRLAQSNPYAQSQYVELGQQVQSALAD